MKELIPRWVKIVGACGDPKTPMVTLFLACGHTVKIRLDTAMGKSWKETEWKAIECYQHEEGEYIPE